MTETELGAIPELRHEIHAVSLRVASLESQYQTTLLSVLKGLKGSDDGDGLGLYERVRSINQMQSLLGERMAVLERLSSERITALEKVCAEHEADKKAVVLSGRTLWLAVTAISGFVAFLVGLLK